MSPEEGQSYLPTNFKRNTAYFKSYSKSINRIIPSTGQVDVTAGMLTIFQLPQASVVDLKTFRLNFHAKTNGTSTTIANLPKFLGSMIERLEIFCNGQSIQNITNYGTIYNIMRDYSKDYPKYSGKIANHADPSKSFSVSDAGVTTEFSSAVAVASDAVTNTREGDYCIDDWVGFLDSAPEFFNTNLVGNLEIHVTWCGNNVLCGDVASPTYTISKLYGWIDVINFKDDAYINELDRIIRVEKQLEIPYKNYRSYLGAVTTNTKTSTTRITESTQSLDKIMLTFLPTTRTTVGALNTTINSSKYYQRSGLGLGYDVAKTATGTVQYEINSQDVCNPLGFVETYQETLKAFELDRDNIRHGNPAIKNLGVYETDFFVSALSTSHLNAPLEPKTIISGIDTNATSLNLSVKTVNQSVTPRSTMTAQSAQPLIITEMTAVLRIGLGREVSVIF